MLSVSSSRECYTTHFTFYSLMNSNYRLSLFSRYNIILPNAVFLLWIRSITTLNFALNIYLPLIYTFKLFVILLSPQRFDRGRKISQWNNYMPCLQTSYRCEKTLLSIILIYFVHLLAQLMQSLGSSLYSTYFVICSVMYLTMLIHSCLVSILLCNFVAFIIFSF